jgi:ankyrin repeat protein
VGRDPLLWAASAGSLYAVAALLAAGADINSRDADGLTGLHCAASRGHTGCVEQLVTAGRAEVDASDGNGCSALFYAVTLGHTRDAELLLAAGAAANRQDRRGRTPAHCAAAKGILSSLKSLHVRFDRPIDKTSYCITVFTV